MRSSVLCPLLVPLLCLHAAVLAPPWADPLLNPCAARPGGWQLLYWPADGQCYRIFTVGPPCPATMELGPGTAGAAAGAAECRCPPKTALSPRDKKCHALYRQGPCPRGQYFAPLRDRPAMANQSLQRWGSCRDVEACPAHDHLHWPRDGDCYPRHTRGPCPKGELLVLSPGSGLAECKCGPDGELAEYYWPPTESCHEHYTRGPCEQQGHLFLPGRVCGCDEALPNYHNETRKCYQIGGLTPCLSGQQFLLPSDPSNATVQSARARCRCKPGLLPWSGDGACYRPFTRGPCPPGQILLNATTCAPIPCRNGRLYFPHAPACFKVGTQGPCPDGQLVLFESVRIAVDGISHRGMCGCSGPGENCSRAGRGEADVAAVGNVVCDRVAGLVRVHDKCFKLYTQGPCEGGEWLVPQREGRQWDEQGGRRRRQKAKCECKPGFKRLRADNGTDVGQCQSPTVVLARFLNQNLNREP